jgi:hypothetical protein
VKQAIPPDVLCRVTFKLDWMPGTTKFAATLQHVHRIQRTKGPVVTLRAAVVTALAKYMKRTDELPAFETFDVLTSDEGARQLERDNARRN